MTKRLLLLLVGCLSLSSLFGQESKIRIRGSIEFPEPRFPIEVFFRDGPNKVVVDSITLQADNSFDKVITLPHAGLYSLDCQKWELIDFWGEDEDILVKFRGQDTAKIKIKNPPFQLIENTGPNNELMNLINFTGHMGYQRMIAAGQAIYNASKSDSEEWKEYVATGYDKSNEVTTTYINYLALAYSDRNSVVALIPRIADVDVKNELVSKLEKTKATYPPFFKWKQAEEDKIAKLSQLEIGAVAPDFSFPTPKGDVLGLRDFRGRYLIIDFWASWCGPCLKLIPHLKEVYAKYNKLGVEVLSVSIDGKEKAWRKAMDTENMPWSQILAPESGKEIMSLYQFAGIPHLILLDKEGRIIGRGLTSDQLDKELEKRFKE